MPSESFIPNDLSLAEDDRIVILTGPNMAGKSTVLRQIGSSTSWLRSARSFRRTGLAYRVRPDLHPGRCLRQSGSGAVDVHGRDERDGVHHPRGHGPELVLLDEIGRGTSTYDGVSIAWAVTEHLHEEVGCKTIFATHYHELTQLGYLLPGAKNMNVIVREVGEEIVFLPEARRRRGRPFVRNPGLRAWPGCPPTSSPAPGNF